MAQSRKAKVVFCSFREMSEALIVQAPPELREEKKALPSQPSQVFNFTQAVFPERPPIDKVGAFVLVERRQKQPIENIAFWGNPQCSSRQLDEWRSNNILPIDLGEEKYNRHGNIVGSATEFIAKQFCLNLSPAEQRLVFLLNDHNSTGKLKGYYMSVAWLIRELYELDEYDHTEVVSRAAHVIEMRLREEEEERLPDRTDEEMHKTFPSYLKETEKCSFAPFTVGRYLRDMWRLGIDPDEIREKVEWWIQAWYKVQTALDEAEKVFQLMEQSGWLGNEYCVGSGLRLRVLGANTNKFLVKKVARSCDVLIVIESSGRAAVLAYSCDVRRLGEALDRREPGLWHTAATQGFVLNGGRMYTEGASTRLGRRELIAAIREYPPVKRRR